jgi:hypothetical protein
MQTNLLFLLDYFYFSYRIVPPVAVFAVSFSKQEVLPHELSPVPFTHSRRTVVGAGDGQCQGRHGHRAGNLPQMP